MATCAALGVAIALAGGTVLAGAVGGSSDAADAGGPGPAAHTGGPPATPLSAALARAPAQVRRISAARVGLAYNTRTLRAKRSRVRIVMRNPSAVSHNVALRGNGLRRPIVGRVVGRGRTSTIVATVRPGRYVFYCSVPGHERAGMRGTLIVSRR